MTTVGVVVGTVAAIVGVVVPVIKLRWDRQDRRRAAEEAAKADRPHLPTFTVQQMRDEVRRRGRRGYDAAPHAARSPSAALLGAIVVVVALVIVLLVLR